MGSIEQRLKRLERVAAPKGNLLFIFVNLCGDEMRGYRSGDVQIKRLPGESVEALTERIMQSYANWRRGKALVFMAY